MGTPIAIASRIEKPPACIEMRLPQTTRERLSRPRSSVPNGFAQVGALRILPQSVRSGSVVAIHGAPIAVVTKIRTTMHPATEAGRPHQAPPATPKPAGRLGGAGRQRENLGGGRSARGVKTHRPLP